MKPGGRVAILLSKDEYSERRLNTWRKDILKGKRLEAFVSLPKWDEDRYGPEANLLIIRNSITKKKVFKTSINTFETIDELIKSFQNR